MRRNCLALVLLVGIIASLAATRRLQPHGVSIHGVELGMTEAQVRANLGEPEHNRPLAPEKGPYPMPPVRAWLNYPNGCQVGLDEAGGQVVFVAGAQLEAEGELLNRDSTEALISSTLGEQLDVSKEAGQPLDVGDPSLHPQLFRGGVVVLQSPPRTFFLRDPMSLAFHQPGIRARDEEDFARRFQQKPPLPPPDGLNIHGICLGMTKDQVLSQGLVGPQEPCADLDTEFLEVGDPRPQPPEQATVILEQGRVIEVGGKFLSRGGSLLIRYGDTRTRVEAALGPPARVRSAGNTGTFLAYPDKLLSFQVFDDRVNAISLGVHPRESEDFTPDEVTRVLGPQKGP